jgi:large-conductance mechanosensitive channel
MVFNDFFRWLIHEKAMFSMIIAYFIGSATNQLSTSFNTSIIIPGIDRLISNRKTPFDYSVLVSSFILFIVNLILAYFLSRFVMKFIKNNKLKNF